MDTDIMSLFEAFGGNDKVQAVSNDHNAPAHKDAVTAKLIPEQISECAIYLKKEHGEPCMSSDAISAVSAAVGVSGTAAQILKGAKNKLACDSERCVLSKLSSAIGEAQTRREINTRLKVKGPTDSKLLSNIHIDSTLKQWASIFPHFFPYNFNMLNYASYAYENGYILNHPDTLATILFADLYQGEIDGKRYKCAGCIINSDTYQGSGKHWMALFACARGDSKWTVEFFNSSGNAPAPEWINWLEKTRVCMEMILDKEKKNIPVEIVKVSSIRHQQSRSECGLYSLFYIWARLNGVPVEYFTTTPILDQLMFEFRQHLFENPNRKTMKKFDWNEYKNTVHISWE